MTSKSLTFPAVGEQESELVETGERDNFTTLDIASGYPLQVVLLLLLFIFLIGALSSFPYPLSYPILSILAALYLITPCCIIVGYRARYASEETEVSWV